jgi:XTP/dITP diphosphohydrolase
VLDADDYPPESGETYYENARAKALFARGRVHDDAWVLGEDSGIEVEGLDGAPGVGRRAAPRSTRSRDAARAGRHRGDGRRARYVSELVAVAPDGQEVRGTGTLERPDRNGAARPGGFGFDPVFVPDGEQRTVAELGDAWKAAHSHRANAARELLRRPGSSSTSVCSRRRDRHQLSSAPKTITFAIT